MSKKYSSQVRKAIIPAAGLGTRFLPATKTVPKEMLTIVDAPIIFYVVQEAIQAGIEDIILIQGRGKTAIEDFFDVSFELEETLLRTKKESLLEDLVKIRNMANIISIRQKQPLGLGHAVLCAKHIIGDEPFAVLLGDEIMHSATGEKNVTHKLCDLYQQTGKSSIAVMQVNDSEVSKYGIAELQQDQNTSLMQVRHLIEKPKIEETQSRWALPGRYVFTPSIFEDLQKTKAGINGEIQLTDAMKTLLQREGIVTTTFQSTRFDAGDKLGFLKANIEMGLQRKDLQQPLREYILNLAARIQK